MALTAGCGGSAHRTGARAGEAAGDAVAEPDPRLDPMLRRVPGDTPYFFGSLEPLSVERAGRELGAWGPAMISAIEEYFDETTDFGANLVELELDYRLLVVLFEELRNRLTPAGLIDLGVGSEIQFVVYGVGLLPAARLRLADGERFRAFIELLAGRWEFPLPVRKAAVGARVVDYWHVGDIGLGEVALVGAVIDDELVVALVARATRDEVVPLLLGADLPSPSLAHTGVVQGIARRYQFAPWSVGYLDLADVARILVGRSGELERAITRALGLSDAPRSCAVELPALVEVVPRLVAGSYGSSAEQVSGAVIVETRSDVTDAFVAMRGSIPGASLIDSEGVKMAFGFGVDLPGASRFLQSRIGSLARSPYRCPWLAEVNRLATGSSGWPASAVPAISGFNVVVRGIESDAATVEGALFLGSDDPRQLVSLLGMAGIYGIGGLNLQPGGHPVALPNGLITPMWSPAYIGLAHDALGVAVGARGEADLAQGLSSDASNASPFLASLRLDRGWWTRREEERRRRAVHGPGGDDGGDELDEPGPASSDRYGDLIVTCSIAHGGLMFEAVQYYRREPAASP